MVKTEMGFDITEKNGLHTLIVRQVQYPKLTDPCRASHFTIGQVEVHSPEESFVISPDFPTPVLPKHFAHVVIIKLLDALPMKNDDDRFVQEKLQLFVAEFNPSILVEERQIWTDARVIPTEVKGRIITIQANNITKHAAGNGVLGGSELASPFVTAQMSIARMRANLTMEKLWR